MVWYKNKHKIYTDYCFAQYIFKPLVFLLIKQQFVFDYEWEYYNGDVKKTATHNFIWVQFICRFACRHFERENPHICSMMFA